MKILKVSLSVALTLVGVVACTSPRQPTPPSATRSQPSVPSSLPATTVGTATVIASNLAVPWGLAFLPDASALVSERDTHRIVRVYPNGQVLGVGVVAGVAENAGEGGLLGLALSPQFPVDHLLYAYLTTNDDNRVVRMTYLDGVLGAPSTIFAGIPKAANHDGGRIAFGPDAMLYVTTGDATKKQRAPDRNYLGGKVLRMTPAGAAAPGNPYPGSVTYTVGHRNPQGLAWGPDGRLYEAEFGQSTEDEINLLTPGANYGWPTVEGTVGPATPGLTAPLATWKTSDASPSGLAFAGDSLWLATLQGKRVYRIPLLGGRVGTPTQLLDGRYGRLRTIVRAPDGSLWITTSNQDGRGAPVDGDDRIIRVPLS